ncbi:prepilin-type N-terminal cleavage/methylation domain-containing protein, partial [Bdellovibrionota bacterium FG-1]
MNRKPTIVRNARGFTLIELMISVVILTFISLGIYQLTVETYHLRDVLSAEGEFYNSVRMAMDILGRDISTIYSPALLKLPQPQPSSNPGSPGLPPKKAGAGSGGNTPDDAKDGSQDLVEKITKLVTGYFSKAIREIS